MDRRDDDDHDDGDDKDGNGGGSCPSRYRLNKNGSPCIKLFTGQVCNVHL